VGLAKFCRNRGKTLPGRVGSILPKKNFELRFFPLPKRYLRSIPASRTIGQNTIEMSPWTMDEDFARNLEENLKGQWRDSESLHKFREGVKAHYPELQRKPIQTKPEEKPDEAAA